MRIVLPLKSSIGPEIRSDSSNKKRMNSDFLKSKFYWEKSSNLDANPFANTAFANGNPNQPQPKY
jgi:hypothetical protein